LDEPYIVLGLIIVWLGTFILGVSGPKAAMVDGENIFIF